MKDRKKTKKGFALLITLVVVSVVLAIGLSLLFVTTKQYLLAVTASESEKGFQAAQIGLECMRWHRASEATKSILLHESGGGAAPSLNCAGVAPDSAGEATTVYNGSGDFLYGYKYRYTLNPSQCSEVSLYVADIRNAASDQSYDVTNEGLSEITCSAGTVCTVIFARGYNRACDETNSIFSVQREITVEY